MDNESWGERLGPRGDIAMRWGDFAVGGDRDPLAPKTAIKDSWVSWLKTSHNKSYKIAEAELFRFLSEKLGMESVTERPTITHEDDVYQLVKGRARYIILPSIDAARAAWQQNMFKVSDWNHGEGPPLDDEGEAITSMIADLKEATWANDNPPPNPDNEAPF